MKKLMGHFLREERGVTAIEYGLIAGLIAIVILGGASALGSNLGTLFKNISACVATAASSTNSGGGTCPVSLSQG